MLDFSAFLLVLERELPRPSTPDGLAGEAIDEAIERVRALGNWLVRGFSSSSSNGVCSASALAGFLSAPSAGRHASASDNDNDDKDSEGDREELPFLLALELVLRHRLGVESGAAAFLGIDEELYKRRCLGGFGRADEWASVVGRVVCEGLKAQPKPITLVLCETLTNPYHSPTFFHYFR